jgi:hypothetical protein
MVLPPKNKPLFVQESSELVLRAMVRRVLGGMMSRRAERRSSRDSEGAASRESVDISESVVVD